MLDATGRVRVWQDVWSSNESGVSGQRGIPAGVSGPRGIPRRKTSSNSVQQEHYDSSRQPLKPALKKQSSSTGSSGRMGRLQKIKTNILNLFPEPDLDSRNALFPDVMSGQAQVKRPTGNARSVSHNSSKSPSVDSRSTTGRQLSETNISHSAKTNLRRPSKPGIQTWFDGLAISSGEEEKARIRVKEPQPVPQELLAIEPLPSTFSPWTMKPEGEQPRLSRRTSRAPVEDDMLSIMHAKERTQERMRLAEQREGTAETETLIRSFVPPDAPGRKRGGESRLAMSVHASRSVLSLSDSSGDERATVPPTKQREEPEGITAFARLAPPKPSALTDFIPLPLPSARRDTPISRSDPITQLPRKLTGRDSILLPPNPRPTTKTSPQGSQETVNKGETARDMPTAASHIMAVTEEEMILLELMRNKRAAMQRSSFTEGYQLALKREQEHLVRRREGAQQSALKLLRQKEEKEKERSKRESKLMDFAVGQDGKAEGWQRRKFSTIREEDVDEALKLERYFMNAETPVMEDDPETPTRSNPADPEEEKQPQQEFELLLPNTYSPSPTSKTLETESPVSPAASSPPPEPEVIEHHHDQVWEFLASGTASEYTSMFPTPPSAKLKSESRNYKRRSISSPSPVAEEEPIPGLPVHSQRWPSPPPEKRDTSRNPRQASKDGEQGHNSNHLPSNPDLTPLDIPSSQLSSQRTASPSLSTSGASPLTPTFTAALAPEKAPPEATSSGDTASYRGRAYTPDTDLTSLSASAPATTTTSASSMKRRQAARKVPPPLDTIPSRGYKRNSMISITSAGEDVLAAWADLGGGSDALASRRRVR